MTRAFEPKLITIFREGYTLKQLYRDLMAGVIVGIVALPLAIAFGIASGVKPEQGLYTAVVAGFLISAFSGSRVQIGGPTGAFIVIVYDIVSQYGQQGLMMATMMAGVMLIIMGVARFGVVIQYIPYPMTVGFTAGIAVIIFTSQVRDFTGLQITGKAPTEFLEKWWFYITNYDLINVPALLIGILSMAIIIFWPKVTHLIPGSLIAIIASIVLVRSFHLDVATIGSRYGEVPNSIPLPHLPDVNWSLNTFRALMSPAFTIAILAGIESLLSAVVADGMIGTRHRSNMELIAQGIANIFSPIFGGIPATGAIARTATNIKNGGRTPIAGIVHAITLLLIMIFFGSYASMIPMASLAAILVIVAFNMGEWHLFAKMLRSGKHDVLVLLTTFLLTVFIDLTVAIEVGIVLASFLFMHRMASLTQTRFVTAMLDENNDEDDTNAITKKQVPKGVEVFEINGPFFFGVASKFKDELQMLRITPKILILRMRYVLTIDATAMKALEDVVDKTRKDGTFIILSGIHAQPLVAITNSGLIDRLGEENVCANIDDALERARTLLQ